MGTMIVKEIKEIEMGEDDYIGLVGLINTKTSFFNNNKRALILGIVKKGTSIDEFIGKNLPVVEGGIYNNLQEFTEKELVKCYEEVKIMYPKLQISHLIPNSNALVNRITGEMYMTEYGL